MKTRKLLWAAAGFLLTGIGAVGAIIPLVPCVVFLLGAAFCFAKSSSKLETGFVEQSSIKIIWQLMQKVKG